MCRPIRKQLADASWTAASCLLATAALHAMAWGTHDGRASTALTLSVCLATLFVVSARFAYCDAHLCWACLVRH